jgi:hypothetical protein
MFISKPCFQTLTAGYIAPLLKHIFTQFFMFLFFSNLLPIQGIEGKWHVLYCTNFVEMYQKI